MARAGFDLYGKVPYVPFMAVSSKKSRPVVSKARSRGSARLEARIPLELKELLEEAAPLAGHSSVTDYLVQTIRENATRTVEAARLSRLNRQESSVFVRSLLRPAAPNRHLRAAFDLHRERVG